MRFLPSPKQGNWQILLERVRSLTSFQVLCLQEVQENHYREQLEPTFVKMGMSCFYVSVFPAHGTG